MMEEGEGRASGGAPKKVVLVATPFTLAISMVTSFLALQGCQKRHENVMISISKCKTVVGSDFINSLLLHSCFFERKK